MCPVPNQLPPSATCGRQAGACCRPRVIVTASHARIAYAAVEKTSVSAWDGSIYGVLTDLLTKFQTGNEQHHHRWCPGHPQRIRTYTICIRHVPVVYCSFSACWFQDGQVFLRQIVSNIF